MKSTHRGVLFLTEFQDTACNFLKSITFPWVLFTFLKLHKWYLPNCANHHIYTHLGSLQRQRDAQRKCFVAANTLFFTCYCWRSKFARKIYIYIYKYFSYTLFRLPQWYFRCTVGLRHERELNFSCPGIECLTYKKPKILIYPKKLCNAGYQISADYPLFLNIKLDRNKTISIWVAHNFISKIKHA